MVVVDVRVVVGAAEAVVVGAALVVADTSGSAVLVVPPEQAEINMLRTRNPATARFMPGVFHEGRSVTQRESPVEHPCVSAILENHGRPTVTICAIRCWSPSLNRQTGLRFQACRRGPVGGAGGNRTPVRRRVTVRATTIPENVAPGCHPAGSGGPGGPATGSFPRVSGLSRRQRSVPAVSTASVAGLRWTDPACRYRSR